MSDEIFSKGEAEAFDELWDIVAIHFKRDYKKVLLWWEAKNPMFGISPIKMFKIGRVEKMLKIIKEFREGNVP